MTPSHSEGLATHEPHFVILREKVIMRGRPRSTLLNSSDEKKAASFQTTDEFQFLHLGPVTYGTLHINTHRVNIAMHNV